MIPDRQIASLESFEQPTRSLFLMVVGVALVAAGFVAFWDRFETIFLQSPYLNGLIIGVFVLGIFACFWQVFQVMWSVIWIERFINSEIREHWSRPPRLLAPLASLLGSSGSRTQLSTLSSRTILDTVSSRMDESRDISRYIGNLLIFLGLLGTFYGLANTVPAVLDTIRSISPQQEDGSLDVFASLVGGIESQLGGMGVAFSSSLLGLAGSLLVGLLDLLAGHGQNRFYRQLEEWLSRITRIGTSQSESLHDDGGGSGVGTGLASVIEELRRSIYASEQSRLASQVEIRNLNASVGKLASALQQRATVEEQNTELLARLQQLSGRQSEIANSLQQLANGMADDETKLLLRAMEQQLIRLVEENVDIRSALVDKDGEHSRLSGSRLFKARR